MIDIITKYFPDLTDLQCQQYEMLDALYRDWNSKINVISRKDIDNLYEHHVLHSLAIAKVLRFKPSTEILDFGTGGGFPGIPLAIMFPQCRFHLIDGIGKKIRVATEISKAIGLTNVEALQRRGEEETRKFDFVVSRAVMPLPDLMKLICKNIRKEQHNALPNGLLCLKGGDLHEELKPFKNMVEVYPLNDFFDEEWYRENKKIIYVPIG